MDEIKPVAVATARIDPLYQGTVQWIKILRPIPMNSNLYDSAALAQARKEGEIKGMREQAKIDERICREIFSDPAWNAELKSSAQSCATAINRAIEEKAK